MSRINERREEVPAQKIEFFALKEVFGEISVLVERDPRKISTISPTTITSGFVIALEATDDGSLTKDNFIMFRNRDGSESATLRIGALINHSNLLSFLMKKRLHQPSNVLDIRNRNNVAVTTNRSAVETLGALIPPPNKQQRASTAEDKLLRLVSQHLRDQG